MLPHALSRLHFVERFYSFSEITSTNDAARSLTEFPTQGIYVIQADRQTKGRGRRDAAFFSSIDGGLWASILTPLNSVDTHFVHNRALSIAIAEAVEEITGNTVSCAIKWPNDICIGTRKLCGILLENHTKRNDMLVIGFGINVSIKQQEFPPDLQPIATSLLIETGKRYSPSRLFEGILRRYHDNLSRDPLQMHGDYSARLPGLGRRIEIEGMTGVFAGVEADGRLRLATGHEVVYIVSGHVRFTDAAEEKGDVCGPRSRAHH
ncbi:MAG: biotin--[acetyl-CoA-carboxylase] ligase [Chitinispirillaceae bacterium]|nr:biotin--[acetyl-CoA-carboxylase] ligase [Chitinispirillaceae bacterium]